MDDQRDNRQKRHHDAARALKVGAVMMIIGVALVLTPFGWGWQFDWDKYFVVVGLLVALLGGGIVLNGGFDWLRSRR